MALFKWLHLIACQYYFNDIIKKNRCSHQQQYRSTVIKAAHTSGSRVLCPFIKHKGPRTVCVLLQNYSRTWTQLLGIHKTAVSSKLGKCETTNKLTWVKSKSIKKNPN